MMHGTFIPIRLPCGQEETGMSKRIALIHATPVAMQPIVEAFRHGWPEAATFSVLDDALSTDLARAGTLNAALKRRIAALAEYVTGVGIDAILYTCSAFGEAIDAVARATPMPVLKPNEAMFEAAMRRGTRIGLLATFQPSIPSLEQEFIDMAKAQRANVTLESVCVPEAMTALTAGDADQHDYRIAEAAPRLAHCDVVMLAQFSMARACPAVQQVLGNKVVTSPDSAVAKLKALLNGHQSS
jgi:aspartate/glutamate racemase